MGFSRPECAGMVVLGASCSGPTPSPCSRHEAGLLDPQSCRNKQCNALTSYLDFSLSSSGSLSSASNTSLSTAFSCQVFPGPRALRPPLVRPAAMLHCLTQWACRLCVLLLNLRVFCACSEYALSGAPGEHIACMGPGHPRPGPEVVPGKARAGGRREFLTWHQLRPARRAPRCTKGKAETQCSVLLVASFSIELKSSWGLLKGRWM